MNLSRLTQNQLSELTGMDRRTIKKRLTDLEPVAEDKRGKYYDSTLALALIYQEETVSGIDKKLLKVQLAYETARQEKAEIEVAKLRGELLPIREVEKALSKEYAFVRAQIRSMPSKFAKPLSMVSDPHMVFSTLSEGVEDALSELKSDAEYKLAADQLERARENDSESTGSMPEADTTDESSGVVGPETVSESGSIKHAGPMEDLKR